MESEYHPFFSIVTISYNQGSYLENCIQSVINQSFKNFEYIIQDPGSSDDSRKILKNYLNDSRIKIFFEKDFSPGDGLNKGFSKAKGLYYLFINADDELCNRALENLYSIINKNPGFDVYSGMAMIIDKNGKALRYTFSDQMNLKRASYGSCIIVQQATCFKSFIFKKVGGFNKKNFINWDGELFIDFAISFAKFKVFNQVIGKYRLTENTITGSGLAMSNCIKNAKEMYFKINKRKPSKFYILNHLFYRLQRKILNYRDTYQRIIHGKISGRYSKRRFIKKINF